MVAQGPRLIKAAYAAPRSSRRVATLAFTSTFSATVNVQDMAVFSKVVGVATAALVSAVSAQSFQRLGTCPTLGMSLQDPADGDIN
jgi:hypothetical protein